MHRLYKLRNSTHMLSLHTPIEPNERIVANDSTGSTIAIIRNIR